MRVLERIGELGGKIGRRVERQPRRIAQYLLQRAAGNQLHGDVGDAVVLADLEDGDDIGMVEPRRGARLAQEALARRGEDLRRQRRQQRPDRHLALDGRIDGAEHRAHGPPPELSQDPVMAQRLVFHAPACLVILREF